MARLTALRPSRDWWIGLGLIAALASVAFAHIAGGWAALAPDDARYLYVGLSILSGHGPVNPNGAIYLLRSPVYGLALAIGSSIIGGDPVIGARAVEGALALLGLVGALRLGWLLAGPGGAAGTGIALVATPLVWQLVPSLRIDLTQTAAIVATLLAVWRPTTRRWALGGVLIGAAILIKETDLPLVLLPLALVGSVPMRRFIRLATAYVGMAVVTAAWWWAVVWVSAGQVFPFNAISVVEARDVTRAYHVGPSLIPLLIAIVAGWGIVAAQARHRPGVRLLLVGAVGLVPAALYAASLGLNARNFAGLAVLSAVAMGTGGAWLVENLWHRWQAPQSRPARVVAATALAAVVVMAAATPAIGQRDVGSVAPDKLADDLSAWLSANVPDGGRIVMAFRERENMALRQFGRIDVATLPLTRVDPADPPAIYLWMGLRDQQLFGYKRSAWNRRLTRPPARFLILVGPHPFSPFNLTASSDTDARLGLSLVTTMDVGDLKVENRSH